MKLPEHFTAARQCFASYGHKVTYSITPGFQWRLLAVEQALCAQSDSNVCRTPDLMIAEVL